jgi:hypothetical protein
VWDSIGSQIMLNPSPSHWYRVDTALTPILSVGIADSKAVSTVRPYDNSSHEKKIERKLLTRNLETLNILIMMLDTFSSGRMFFDW